MKVCTRIGTAVNKRAKLFGFPVSALKLVGPLMYFFLFKKEKAAIRGHGVKNRAYLILMCFYSTFDVHA
jgi:hypothetical protein